METALLILTYLFYLISFLFALYLLIPFFSLLSYGFVQLFRVKTPYERRKFLTDKSFDFGLIITAHQETAFVHPLVDSILKQTYQQFQVYVVADDCDPEQLRFAHPKVTVLHPEPALHAKIKSIRYGLSHFSRKHDAVIILDVDNLIHPSYLEVMNNHFRKGYRVVQCDFKPKNTDTPFARMDAIGDIFNFFTEREIRMRLGMSSTIWGSGVAIDLELYNEVEYSSLLGGFDKKLQAHLVKRVDQIAFAPAAVLYDEKITSGQALEQQRTRWINAYFKYFSLGWGIFTAGLRRLSPNLLFFGFNTLRPPLFITLGIAFLLAVLSYWVSPALFPLWAGVIATFALSFLLIVVVKSTDKRIVLDILRLPLFIVRQLLALFKIKSANKSFLKTEHHKVVFIDDLLRNGAA
jgi:cellulose synthase/poly-beta-1,6-N-acetylglucosamine synthase-like glycosyltransferase